MTPNAGSNFSRYVIPSDTSPAGVCCVCVPVPDDVEWRAQFSGALWRLSLQTNYERDDAHSGKVVAARWREVWMEVSEMACCCGNAAGEIVNITYNQVQIQIYLETLKQVWIDAAFDIDVAFPETPDLFDSDPGDSPAEAVQRNRALCLAVQSWVNDLMNRGIDYVEKSVTVATPLAIGGLANPIVPVWLVGGAFAALALTLAELHSQLADQEYREYLVCGMYEALKGKDTNSPTDFAESWDSLPARPPPPESALENIARDAIEAWGRSQLNNVDNYIGFIKTLNTAMSIASSLSDADCACLEIEMEISLAGFPGITLEPVLEDLGSGQWRCTSGIYTHPTAGLTAWYQVIRAGGGCFDIDAIVKTSGTLSRTSWNPCGGGAFFTDNPVPIAKLNNFAYSNSNIGSPVGFVVEFGVSLP